MKIDIKHRDDDVFVLTIEKIHIPLTKEQLTELNDHIVNAMIPKQSE